MCLYPVQIKQNGERFTVKCGKCIECQRALTQEWALRIMLEAREHKQNCCLTLTYDNDHVPQDYELSRRDIQLFLKSLRKALSPVKIRIFYSGEYGEKLGRPHFHCIIFGWIPSDIYFHFTKKGNTYYKSPMCEKIWNRGFVSVGELTYETAFYCAKYLQKFAGSSKSVRPFVGMSNRPGIGFGAITPDLIKSGCFYYHGEKYVLPRYFQKVLERTADVSDIARLRVRRRAALTQSLRCSDSDSLDSRRDKESVFLGKESWEFFINPLDK